MIDDDVVAAVPNKRRSNKEEGFLLYVGLGTVKFIVKVRFSIVPKKCPCEKTGSLCISNDFNGSDHVCSMRHVSCYIRIKCEQWIRRNSF